MPNTRTTSFEVEYYLEDTNAREDAILSTSSNKSFGDITLLRTHGEDIRYMICEKDLVLLDGSFSYFPVDTSTVDFAFFSNELSNASGYFTNNPIITIDFAERTHSSFALTLFFSDNTPQEINIKWYSVDNVIIGETTALVTDNKCVVYYDVENYKKIIIEFTKAKPYSYIKMYRIIYGLTIIWDERNVHSASIVQEMDRISDKLPIDTLSFDVIDVDHNLNLGNTAGLHNYFQKRQIMYPYEWVNGTKLSLGKYFLDKFSNESNLGKMNSVGYMGLLDGSDYIDGSLYQGGVTVRTLVQSILTTTVGLIEDTTADGTGEGDYWIQPEVRNIMLYGALEPMTCREALREILFASGSIVDTSKLDKIRILIPANSIDDELTRNDKISTKVTKKEYVYGIKLEYNDYTLDEGDSTIIEDVYEPGTYQINFGAPYSISTIAITGGTLTSVHTFYCTFEVADETTVTIIGKKYTKTSNSVTITESNLEAGESKTIKSFKSALANVAIAKRLARSILNFYANRIELNIQHIAKNPTMENWKIVENTNPRYENYMAMFTKRNFDLTGGFIDNATLVGYQNLRDYYYAGVDLYAGEELGIV